MPTIKTRRKTGWIALTFHWFMICCTLGLWYPVYASRRRSRVSVTHIPPGYATPPQQPYGYGQPPAYGPPPGHYPPPQRYGPPPQQYGQVPPGQWGQPRR